MKNQSAADFPLSRATSSPRSARRGFAADLRSDDAPRQPLQDSRRPPDQLPRNTFIASAKEFEENCGTGSVARSQMPVGTSLGQLCGRFGPVSHRLTWFQFADKISDEKYCPCRRNHVEVSYSR